MERLVKSFSLSLLCVVALSASLSAEQPEFVPGKWVPLFNGKDLDDWTIKIRRHEAGDNFANTFRVENGVIKVGYEGYEKFDETFGHMFYNRPFSNYRLRVEYRFLGEQCPGGPGWAFRNSGLMLHGESPSTMGVDQDFPASIEVQLLGGNGVDKRTTANLCTPGTNVVIDGKLIEKPVLRDMQRIISIAERISS